MSATNSHPSFNVHQHLQHTTSNSCHIQCPLAPANTSQRICNHLTPVAYYADGAPRCSSHPTHAHVLVHQESSGNDSTFDMHAQHALFLHFLTRHSFREFSHWGGVLRYSLSRHNKYITIYSYIYSNCTVCNYLYLNNDLTPPLPWWTRRL